MKFLNYTLFIFAAISTLSLGSFMTNENKLNNDEDISISKYTLENAHKKIAENYSSKYITSGSTEIFPIDLNDANNKSVINNFELNTIYGVQINYQNTACNTQLECPVTEISFSSIGETISDNIEDSLGVTVGNASFTLVSSKLVNVEITNTVTPSFFTVRNLFQQDGKYSTDPKSELETIYSYTDNGSKGELIIDYSTWGSDIKNEITNVYLVDDRNTSTESDDITIDTYNNLDFNKNQNNKISIDIDERQLQQNIPGNIKGNIKVKLEISYDNASQDTYAIGSTLSDTDSFEWFTPATDSQIKTSFKQNVDNIDISVDLNDFLDNSNSSVISYTISKENDSNELDITSNFSDLDKDNIYTAKISTLEKDTNYNLNIGHLDNEGNLSIFTYSFNSSLPQSNGEDSSNLGIIIGSIIGGTSMLAMGIGIIVYLKKRKQSNDESLLY